MEHHIVSLSLSRGKVRGKQYLSFTSVHLQATIHTDVALSLLLKAGHNARRSSQQSEKGWKKLVGCEQNDMWRSEGENACVCVCVSEGREKEEI